MIDCDLRRPSIAKTVGIDTYAAGLTSLIGNSAKPRECIKKGLMSVALDIIPSGPLPAQPTVYLSSARFEAILNELRKHYDRIIIDCPPTQAVSDTLLLSKIADGVIYAVKSGDTPIGLVKRGLDRLKQAKARVIGIVVTQVDYRSLQDYGADHYYQGYDSVYHDQQIEYRGERGKKYRSQKRNERSARIRSLSEADSDIGQPVTSTQEYLKNNTRYAFNGY